MPEDLQQFSDTDSEVQKMVSELRAELDFRMARAIQDMPQDTQSGIRQRVSAEFLRQKERAVRASVTFTAARGVEGAKRLSAAFEILKRELVDKPPT